MIQRETGGNLAEILEKVAYTIRERFRILGDLKTLTTSSRMSAWLLCGLPIFVALVVTVMNPEYMSVLWKDPRGHYLIAAALFMQITGMLIVQEDFADQDLVLQITTRQRAQHMLLIIAISTFVCISLGMLGVYWLLYRPQSAATERLRRLAGRSGIATRRRASDSSCRMRAPAADIAQRLATPINKLLPASATEAKKLQKQLMHAGFRSNGSSDYLSRDSSRFDGRLPAYGRRSLRFAGATATERTGLYHPCVRDRVCSASFCSEKNHKQPAKRSALGSRGCARPDGCLC